MEVDADGRYVSKLDLILSSGTWFLFASCERAAVFDDIICWCDTSART